MKLEKPWLANYDPEVPESIVYPELCVHNLLRQQALSNPQNTAIIDKNRCINYQQLDQLSTNIAMHLVSSGLTLGDRVGICLPNTIEFAVAFFGVLKAGGIVAALNPVFPRRELEFQVRKAGIRFAVIPENRVEDFIGIQRSTTLEKTFAVYDAILNPSMTRQTQSGNEPVSFSALMEKTSPEQDLPEILPSQPAVFQFSGGTTGIPKIAVATHQNIVANVMQFSRWLVNLRSNVETFLVVIPLYHVYGMVLGLNLGIAMGARMVFIRDPRNIEEILSQAVKYHVSYFPAVPSTFNMINQFHGVKEGKYNLQMIKACISGSAPLPENVRVQFEKLTGGYLVEGYGLSEAPTATHCNPILGENKKGSIGLPLPDVACRIVSMEESDRDVNPGEAGELLIKAPQVMTGYYNDELESSITLKDGWLHTGDIARMDNDGYFYILGRSKDLIKVHGLQVWPAEVEEVILKHPAVRECVVAGVPDENSGERVKVWVVLEETKSITLSELREFCRGQIARYKVPTELEICEDIPKSPVGKVLRRELVQRHLAQIK